MSANTAAVTGLNYLKSRLVMLYCVNISTPLVVRCSCRVSTRVLRPFSRPHTDHFSDLLQEKYWFRTRISGY